LEPGLCLNKKTCNLYGVRADILDKEKIRFDATPLMEDMHVSLSLIALGYDTALISEWVWNQPGSGAAGGCSLYRDLELQKDSARKLASLHKPFVSIIRREASVPTAGSSLSVNGGSMCAWIGPEPCRAPVRRLDPGCFEYYCIQLSFLYDTNEQNAAANTAYNASY